MTAKAKKCKKCGNEIPAERVEAVPGTALCVACSAKVGGEFQYSHTNENLAKVNSTKKNFGGVNIEKNRKPDAWLYASDEPAEPAAE